MTVRLLEGGAVIKTSALLQTGLCPSALHWNLNLYIKRFVFVDAIKIKSDLTTRNFYSWPLSFINITCNKTPFVMLLHIKCTAVPPSAYFIIWMEIFYISCHGAWLLRACVDNGSEYSVKNIRYSIIIFSVLEFSFCFHRFPINRV